ncbi:MAG: transglutaminase family protein, partial [Planctomycetota bacterium]
QVSGKTLGDRLEVTTIDENGKKKRRYKWDANAWGVLGVHSLLLAHPMKPGDMRTCKIFVPKLSAIVDVEMIASEPELTSLPGGATPELIPVNVLMKHKDLALRSKNWIDENGIILKTVAYGNQMVSTFRAPPEIAEVVRDEMLVNSKLKERVEYRGARPTPDAAVTYKIEGSEIDLFAMWDKSPRQQVKSLSALSSEVSVEPSPALAAPNSEAADARYVEASQFLQSDHETILRLAKKLASGAKDAKPESVADQIALNLRQIVKQTSETSKFASSLETARKLSGDAKAHSTLLVAALRSIKVPARLAFGICWDEQDNLFRLHVWAEAQVEEGWIAFEPRTGKRLGSDALKLFDSALATSNPYEPMLRVYDDMSHINIRRSRSN